MVFFKQANSGPFIREREKRSHQSKTAFDRYKVRVGADPVSSVKNYVAILKNISQTFRLPDHNPAMVQLPLIV